MFEDVTKLHVHSVFLPYLHQRLGHANLDGVNQVLRRYDLPFSNKRLSVICLDCCLGKMHKLPFPISSFQASRPLDLVCSDVWGHHLVLRFIIGDITFYSMITPANTRGFILCDTGHICFMFLSNFGS
ncbi:hypothetical protein LINPERHAP2_LOCUS36058 [Linum perenne]